MADLALEVNRGDAVSLNVGPVLDAAGAVVNITGYELWFTGKLAVSDLDAAAVFQKTTTAGSIVITNGPAGLARVDLAAADTSALTSSTLLYVDLQAKASGKVVTLARGRLLVVADVTRAA